MPAVPARYFDGEFAVEREVMVELAHDGLILVLPGGERKSWSFRGLRAVDPPVPGHSLRLAHDSATGARLGIRSDAFNADLLRCAPHLRGGINPNRLMRTGEIIAASVVAVAGIIYLLFSFAPQKLAFVMPDSWRTRLGESVEKSFVAEAKTCTNAPGQTALDRLAARMREGNPGLPPFSLRVYDIPVLNAFALPGGRIVIFRELINRANTADEVAGVLAHELGHISMRHAEAQLIRTVGLQLLLSMASGGGTGGDNLGSFAGLLAILSYSRGAETDADAFGQQTLSNAEIDPLGLKRFFEMVAKEQGEPLKGVFGRIGNMMSTHPVTNERIEAIKPLPGPSRPVLSDADWKALKEICG